MALLRVSSKALGEEVDVSATVGDGDGGVEHGRALVRFAESATRGSEDLAEARAALRDAVGSAGLMLAAATIGIFNGLVRTADATGIPLDDGTLKASADFREELGLNAFAGAASTSTDRPAGESTVEFGNFGESSAAKLFGFE